MLLNEVCMIWNLGNDSASSYIRMIISENFVFFFISRDWSWWMDWISYLLQVVLAILFGSFKLTLLQGQMLFELS